MPSYNYRCKECNRVSELVHSMDSTEEKNCLNCNSTELTRVFVSDKTTVLIQGTGFYQQSKVR